MHPKIVGISVVMCILFSGFAIAGTIYTWTDADGVKRYSNSQPPEDAQNVKTIQEVEDTTQDEGQKQEAFDRMVEQAGEEADRHFEEQAEKKAQEEKADQQRLQESRNRKIEKERERLQKEMEAIQQRGLGPTYTVGMKENQIREVQDQIERLENDPVAYFKK